MRTRRAIAYAETDRTGTDPRNAGRTCGQRRTSLAAGRTETVLAPSAPRTGATHHETRNTMTLAYLLNLFGVAVFAISGALAAVRKELDLLGIIVIATVTAVGGGTVRDLLLDRPVFWIYERENLITAVGAALFTLLYVRFRRPPDRSLMVADALGLAFFTISGMQVALALNHPGPIAVIMGVTTGCVGGVTRDILTAEIPIILRGNGLYATAAITGATLYLLLEALDVPRPLPSLIGVTSVAFVRIASVMWGIRLPVFKPPEESGE